MNFKAFQTSMAFADKVGNPGDYTQFVLVTSFCSFSTFLCLSLAYSYGHLLRLFVRLLSSSYVYLSTFCHFLHLYFLFCIFLIVFAVHLFSSIGTILRI